GCDRDVRTSVPTVSRDSSTALCSPTRVCALCSAPLDPGGGGERRTRQIQLSSLLPYAELRPTIERGNSCPKRLGIVASPRPLWRAESIECDVSRGPHQADLLSSGPFCFLEPSPPSRAYPAPKGS